MCHLSYRSLCLLSWILSGSALDLADVTLVNPDPVVMSPDSSLLCVSSDWTSSGSLSVGRDFPSAFSHLTSLSTIPDKTYRSASKMAWRDRNNAFGSFYCRTRSLDSSKIYTFKMLKEANFLPEALTITASLGDEVNISYTRRNVVDVDSVIFKNGDCSVNRWGADCSKACPVCQNGGVCHDGRGGCICPPGFKGPNCQTVCGEGRFGRSCKERCRDGQCRSMVFCQQDPYGCSCATGWKGLNCSEACPEGYYGAGCKLSCQCGPKGKCDRFRGCVCPGRHGSRCENEGNVNKVDITLRDVELNSGSLYEVNCTATGHPAPLHGEIMLVKPDKTPVYVSWKKTAPSHELSNWALSLTSSFQVPPQPRCSPSLNESGPHHLLIQVNKDPYIGDGPLTSVKVFYKQVNASSCKTIEVTGSQTKLDNLTPMTQYTVYVQLSRRGPGGTGNAGPEASFSTQMLEYPHPTGLKLTPLSQTALNLNWDPVTGPTKDDWGFQVECVQSLDQGNSRKFHLPVNLTGLRLTDLKPRHKYECKVWLTTSSEEQYRPRVSGWTLSNELPPAPSNINPCNISDTSAIVTWMLEEGNSISKVMIRFQDEQEDYSQLVEISVPMDQQAMQFQLRGLKPNTLYLVDLWCRNNIGESTDRPQVPFKTLTHQEVASESLSGLHTEGNMLFFAILGSAAMTCITILLAFCIVLQLKKATFQRRMVQAFQNIVREEPVVQFSSGSLNNPKKSKTSTQATLAYPALEWSDIKFEDVIGEGNFGQVLKARIKKDGLRMDAAIKRMKEYASKDDHRDFAGELEVLCKLGHHPNIINLLGACEHRGYLYLAIEYAPHGNLLDFLRKSRVLETDPAFAIANSTASTLTSQQLLHFAADVARGMDYLSQKQFIHRDLAARNILVGENFVAKIADFGLSRGQEVYVKKTMGRLPVRWMAIESLNYSVYTTNSLFQDRGTPYCGLTCAELYEKLPHGYRLEKPLNCDDEVYDLMRQCWREKPYERPSFAQILVALNRMLEERKTYVNTTLYEKFTYAGIDCSAEEAG
uniref:receptor protein-tyrosine kinase n=1 Tax=Denticeps clupeoides TaxID=299321 RepID=A0AAY4A4Q0_9TELE